MNRKLTNQLNVYLEVGSRRTFAAAIDWPGWCRMGPDEATALQTLLDYGPRMRAFCARRGWASRHPTLSRLSQSWND